MADNESWSYFTDDLSNEQCREMLVDVLDLGRTLMLHHRRVGNQPHRDAEDRNHSASMSSAHNDIQNQAMDFYKRVMGEV